MKSKENLVITIGREFGSGGRELGRRLAEAFGMTYYDKELLQQAAQRSGMSCDYFERNDERVPSFFTGVLSFAFGFNPVNTYAMSNSISGDSIYHCQSEFIESLVDRHPCVIVGRTADFVLRHHKSLLSIFVHAPIEQCVTRAMSRDPELSFDRAKAAVQRINKLRAGYYNFYTDKVWGAASSYDLTFDTSKLSMDAIVEVVRKYITERFGPEAFVPQDESSRM